MDRELVYKIIRKTIIFSLIIIGIFMLFFDNSKPIILGFIFGSIIGILGFKLLHTTISRAVDMNPRKASYYTSIHYTLRYLIYFIVLSVAAIADYLNFLTTILGLLLIRFIILGYGSLGKLNKIKKEG